MFFDGNDINIDFGFLEDQMPIENYKLEIMNHDKYFTSKEGFLKGNMFRDEYIPYKNYKIEELKPANAKEKMLFEIMEKEFAFNDLDLYLDVYPEDMNALNLFKKYVEEYKKLKEDYASMYGPLSLDQAKYSNFEWVKEPWPWERYGGNFYV